MNSFSVSLPYRKTFFGIVIAALLLRLAAVAFFHPPLISDDKDYDAIARSLASGNGFSLDGKATAYRLPAYPLLLAATYTVFGDSKIPMELIQVLSDVASCVLLFAIGKKMFSEKVGVIAAALLAFFPIQILYVSFMMTETTFTTVLLAIVWLTVADESEFQKPRTAVTLGVLVGAGILLRSVAALMPVVIFLYRRRCGTSLKINVRSFVIVGASAFLMISPWIVRNYAEFHRMSVTSNGGVNFWIGNHSGASGGYSFPQNNNPLIAINDDFERSDAGFMLGLQFIQHHPFEYGVLEGKKFAHFFASDYWLMTMMQYKPQWAAFPNAATIFGELSLVNALLLHLPYIIVLLLGTFGLVCAAHKDGRNIFFLRTVLLSWLAVHLIFYADARYRFPVIPLIILAASYGGLLIKENVFPRTKMRLAFFAFLCILFIGGWGAEVFTIRAKMKPVEEIGKLSPAKMSESSRLTTR